MAPCPSSPTCCIPLRYRPCFKLLWTLLDSLKQAIGQDVTYPKSAVWLRDWCKNLADVFRWTCVASPRLREGLACRSREQLLRKLFGQPPSMALLHQSSFPFCWVLRCSVCDISFASTATDCNIPRPGLTSLQAPAEPFIFHNIPAVFVCHSSQVPCVCPPAPIQQR